MQYYYGFMGLTIYYMLKRNYKKQLVIKEEKQKKYYKKKNKKKDDIMLFVSGLPTNARPLKSKLHQLFKPYVNNKRFKIKLGVNNLNHGLGFAYVFLPSKHLAEKAIIDLHNKELTHDEFFEIILNNANDNNNNNNNNETTIKKYVKIQVSHSIGKVDVLFADLKPEQRKLIQLDTVALFSVTDMLNSKTINKILNALCSCINISTKKVTITDGCACVGGNVLAFSDIFKTVHAIEIDETRCKMLKYNMEEVCKKTNVKVYNDDYSKTYMTYSQDIIYLDPPWGGTQYTTTDKEDKLYLGKTTLIEYVNLLQTVCSVCTARVPSHYDVTNFAKQVIKYSVDNNNKLTYNRNGKKYIEMPLIFRMNIGTKAILLIVIYPPSSVNNNKLLNFGIKCLDTIVKQLYLCDKKGKKLKQKFYDWDVNRWIRLGAWHGV